MSVGMRRDALDFSSRLGEQLYDVEHQLLRSASGMLPASSPQCCPSLEVRCGAGEGVARRGAGRERAGASDARRQQRSSTGPVGEGTAVSELSTSATRSEFSEQQVVHVRDVGFAFSPNDSQQNLIDWMRRRTRVSLKTRGAKPGTEPDRLLQVSPRRTTSCPPTTLTFPQTPHFSTFRVSFSPLTST